VDKKPRQLKRILLKFQNQMPNLSKMMPSSQIRIKFSEHRQMFDKLFLATSAQSDRIHNEVLQIKSMQARQRDEVSDMKSSLIQMSAALSQDSTSYRSNSTPKTSSFFFGTPEGVPRPSIQVLQTDIVYDKELKVSSLEGLQYSATQLQLLSSEYPGREIRLTNMISLSQIDKIRFVSNQVSAPIQIKNHFRHTFVAGVFVFVR
jgi:hypothetical protein